MRKTFIFIVVILLIVSLLSTGLLVIFSDTTHAPSTPPTNATGTINP